MRGSERPPPPPRWKFPRSRVGASDAVRDRAGRLAARPPYVRAGPADSSPPAALGKDEKAQVPCRPSLRAPVRRSRCSRSCPSRPRAGRRPPAGCGLAAGGLGGAAPGGTWRWPGRTLLCASPYGKPFCFLFEMVCMQKVKFRLPSPLPSAVFPRGKLGVLRVGETAAHLVPGLLALLIPAGTALAGPHRELPAACCSRCGCPEGAEPGCSHGVAWNARLTTACGVQRECQNVLM